MILFHVVEMDEQYLVICDRAVSTTISLELLVTSGWCWCCATDFGCSQNMLVAVVGVILYWGVKMVDVGVIVI